MLWPPTSKFSLIILTLSSYLVIWLPLGFYVFVIYLQQVHAHMGGNTRDANKRSHNWKDTSNSVLIPCWWWRQLLSHWVYSTMSVWVAFSVWIKVRVKAEGTCWTWELSNASSITARVSAAFKINTFTYSTRSAVKESRTTYTHKHIELTKMLTTGCKLQSGAIIPSQIISTRWEGQ